MLSIEAISARNKPKQETDVIVGSPVGAHKWAGILAVDWMSVGVARRLISGEIERGRKVLQNRGEAMVFAPECCQNTARWNIAQRKNLSRRQADEEPRGLPEPYIGDGLFDPVREVSCVAKSYLALCLNLAECRQHLFRRERHCGQFDLER